MTRRPFKLSTALVLALATAIPSLPADAMPVSASSAPVYSAADAELVLVARRSPRVRAARRARPIARPGVVRPGAIRRPVVVVRPWRPRPHYGRIIAGVALGTIIVVAVARSVPAQPAPNVCWYWVSPSQTDGYWDYCQ
jgi:hypothetical protein